MAGKEEFLAEVEKIGTALGDQATSLENIAGDITRLANANAGGLSKADTDEIFGKVQAAAAAVRTSADAVKAVADITPEPEPEPTPEEPTA